MTNRQIISDLTQTTAVDDYTSVIVEEIPLAAALRLGVSLTQRRKGAKGEEDMVRVRFVVTTAAGEPAPEEWWRRLKEAERLEKLEAAAAGRLDAMPATEACELARRALDDGSSGGGWRLMRFLRRCQNDPPAAWPPEIRAPVLRILAARMP